MIKKNFYEQKLEEIKKLLNKNELIKAKISLEEELSMPYIPEKYEEKFNELLKDLVVNLLDGTKDNKTFSVDALLKMLFSNEQDQSIAIELISTHNLRPYVLDIKNRIETWTKEDNIKKSFLFETLVEQEINIDINFNGKIINPIKDSILSNNEVVLALNSIKDLVAKEPNLQAITIDELKRYLLLIFPNSLKNGVLLAKQMVNIVKSLQGQKIELTKEELEIKEILS